MHIQQVITALIMIAPILKWWIKVIHQRTQQELAGGNTGDSHTAILSQGTHDDIMLGDLADDGLRPPNGRTRSIDYGQRVRVGFAWELGEWRGGGNPDTERFHVSYGQPILPCGLNEADKGEYSQGVSIVW